MGGQIKTLIIPRSARLILLVLSWSLVFAQGDSLGPLPGGTGESTPNPHAEGAECSLCHGAAYAGEEGVDHTLCYGCHQLDEYRSKRYRHTADQGCLACHQNHRPKGEPLLKRDPIDLCAECHESVSNTRTHPMRVRDPNTGGELTCTSSCHDVHGTDFKYLCRLEPGRALCVSCHEDFK